MPIYEYECEKCGQIEEVIQKFSDSPLTTCSHCSGSLHKLISQSTFHLKGGGWYVTDYANKTSNTDTAATKTESKKPEASSGDSASTTKSTD